MTSAGKVYLIGAGPGDPELMTLRALRLLSEAEIVVYDRLVSPDILALCPEGAERIAVGKAPECHPVPQEQINDLLLEHAGEGRIVARLKGGDPLIFGRGSEEAAHLRAHGIEVAIVPGITAAQGAASATGVPLTHRGLAGAVQYVTGHRQAGQVLDLDWKRLADPDSTLVIYMGVANIGQIAMGLMTEGLDPATPVLAVAEVTTPRERRLLSRLDMLGRDVRTAKLEAPVLFMIGRVVSLYSKIALPEDVAAKAMAAAHA
ncbi:uroporphyrinogen-III C-methyltransferase [Sedimentitalea todarodis]|uniref:uroporphyrinogen-III C-methyltransferase n=1 Tax=Sedimentitalea todarodis TaxID=1631240 RepID=A0ABU3VGP4_9RHOB|nr:uroporphyrinogen-III C-methyltransferase [Sedimentitalea todarodis]MDU9005349.1 uroporphyrinogen-III C-methyltransferase [Sedimentitalea todarodis]